MSQTFFYARTTRVLLHFGVNIIVHMYMFYIIGNRGSIVLTSLHRSTFIWQHSSPFSSSSRFISEKVEIRFIILIMIGNFIIQLWLVFFVNCYITRRNYFFIKLGTWIWQSKSCPKVTSDYCKFSRNHSLSYSLRKNSTWKIQTIGS